MNMLKKTLLLVCMMALVVCISVGATLAYLTSQDTVTNTFTVGKVDIELWETKVDTEGKPVEGADPVKANEYHLLPGQTYVKDPTVTVKPESDEAYVRMLVTVNDINKLKNAFPKVDAENNPIEANAKYYFTKDNKDFFLLQNLVKGWAQDKWPCYGIVENADNSAVYEFRYYTTVKNESKTEGMKLEPLFTSIEVPGEIVNDRLADLANAQITVVAHAMQKAGFDTADDAWEKFDPAK